MKDIISLLPKPTVLQVVLSHFWGILESVSIAIMMSPVVLIVGKDFRTEVLVAIDMNVTIRICLEFTHRTAIEVDSHTRWILWFNVFHINLTCHRFVAILDRCITLTDLHTLHPTAWYIA